MVDTTTQIGAVTRTLRLTEVDGQPLERSRWPRPTPPLSTTSGRR